MAEVQFKSSRRLLPPPRELKRPKSDLDTRNVVLRSIQTPKVTGTPVDIWDPLDLDWDANRDKALKTMQDRYRRESCSNSTGSTSSSSKHHRSGSRYRDDADSKKGWQMPTEDGNHPVPVAGIHRPTLDWSQDILEPHARFICTICMHRIWWSCYCLMSVKQQIH